MSPKPIPRSLPRMSFEDYMAFERQSEARHEFHAGLVTMTGLSDFAHAVASANWLTTLGTIARECRCKVLGIGMGVWIASEETAVYPDLAMYCGKQLFRDMSECFATNPSLVVEVMTDASREHDLTCKQALYREIPSMQQYICMDSHSVKICCWSKRNGCDWEGEEFSKLTEEIAIVSLGRSLRLEQLYDGLL